MKATIKYFIIQKKTEALRAVVTYYETNHLPDLIETTGRSQAERLNSAREDVNSFKVDVNDYRHHKRFDLLDISKSEMSNYIRLYAIEARETANNFPSNPLIKWMFYRQAIDAIHELKSLLPELEVYSNNFLSSRVKISLTY